MIVEFASPTPLHAEVAWAVVSFFEEWAEATAVCVIGSCARGQAVRQSDVDMIVLVKPETADARRDALAHAWARFSGTSEPVQRLLASSPFAAVHVDLIDGEYAPACWDDGGGPDDFEVEIGNHVVYSVPLWCRGAHYEQLRSQWLPYYGESLRLARLEMVREACLRDLDFVPFYIDRGLHFQAFDRLYKAFRELLQAVFIAHRVYPIAYNKWIREQVCGLLDAPSLYRQLPGVLEVAQLEGRDLLANAAAVRDLLAEWARP